MHRADEAGADELMALAVQVVAKRACAEAALLFDRTASPLRDSFGSGELEAFAQRRGKVPAAAARLAAKDAVREALLQAGISREILPAPADIRIARDAFGRPSVDLPDAVASWLSQAGLGLELSLTHADALAAAVAVIAP